MAVKNVFVPFSVFQIQVASKEIGVMADIADQYLKALGNTKHPAGPLYKDMMYLPYPFQQSFTAHCIDYCSSRPGIEKLYKEWEKENGAKMTEHTVLPIKFDKNHTFANMRSGRLDAFLENAITQEEYDKNAEMPIIIDTDRSNFAFPIAGSMEHPEMIVYRTNNPENFLERMPNRYEQTAMYRPPLSPVVDGQGKFMVGGFGIRYGDGSRLWRVRIVGEMYNHLVETYGPDAPSELVMADFGEFNENPHCNVCPDSEECDRRTCTGFITPDMPDSDLLHELAFPAARDIGNVRGEILHNGTTTFLSTWFEY